MRLIAPLFRDRDDTPCKGLRLHSNKRIAPSTETKNFKKVGTNDGTAIKNVTTSNSGREDALAFIELSNFLRMISDFCLLSLANTADWKIATCQSHVPLPMWGQR